MGVCRVRGAEDCQSRVRGYFEDRQPEIVEGTNVSGAKKETCDVVLLSRQCRLNMRSHSLVCRVHELRRPHWLAFAPDVNSFCLQHLGLIFIIRPLPRSEFAPRSPFELPDCLFPLPLFSQVKYQLLAVDRPIIDALDLFEVMRFAEHVEEFLYDELEVGYPGLVVFLHPLHLVCDCFGGCARFAQAIFEVRYVGFERSQHLVSVHFVDQLDLFLCDSSELGLKPFDLNQGIVQPFLLDKLADEVGDRAAKSAGKVLA